MMGCTERPEMAVPEAEKGTKVTHVNYNMYTHICTCFKHLDE